MPKFDELLKEARTGRVQVIHEFLTNYDPSKDRLHCFYEGREDEIFYRNFISPRFRGRLIPYICGNKDEVYGVLAAVAIHSDCNQSLFFVDKDLSDVIGESRPTHQRLFVTSYYSIENYLVIVDVLTRFCRDFIQCRGFQWDHDKACGEFSAAATRFYKLVLPIMAWILTVRRHGQRPNLRNLKLKPLFTVDTNLNITKALKRDRISHLCATTGISNIPGLARQIRAALKEIQSHPPKTVVRGHFESWFFVEYIKALFDRLKLEAEKIKGAVSMIPAVEHSSFVALAVPTITIPAELDTFLNATLQPGGAPFSQKQKG